MSKYINNKTYEIIDNVDFFEVDDDIAEVISILNKKGYFTNACCSGHHDGECYKFEADISLLDETDDNFAIGKVYEDKFEYFTGYQETRIYIMFKEKYIFKTLPKGFIVEENIPDDSRTVISKVIEFYENRSLKSDNVIEEELKNAQNELLLWAKKLD